ncbi:poly-binding protein 4, partial [Moniliophthora roreri]
YHYHPCYSLYLNTLRYLESLSHKFTARLPRTSFFVCFWLLATAVLIWTKYPVSRFDNKYGRIPPSASALDLECFISCHGNPQKALKSVDSTDMYLFHLLFKPSDRPITPSPKSDISDEKEC